MSRYLRDTYIKNISLNEDRLHLINDAFVEIANTNNRGLPDDDDGKNKTAIVSYLIRFDNKGFVLHDFNEVLKYHKNSKKIERIFFIVDTNQSHFSNAQFGKRAELRFDSKEPNNCILTVQDDDQNWVNATFCKIEEELSKYKNRNFIVRNAWTPFVVQILGVITGFVISLWAALRISPLLSVEYSLIVSFILAFLIFSNIWTYLNQQILKLINGMFPNVAFKDSKGLHWLGKALLSALFVGAAVLLLNEIFVYIGLLLNEILVSNK